MGCDIHLKLERCVHGVDAATVAARTALLIIAERAKKQAEHEPQNAFERMPPELWQRCATLVSVTNGGRVDKWLECPFLKGSMCLWTSSSGPFKVLFC